MTKAKRIDMVKRFIREPYAWPGGYPCYLITADSGILSHEACKDCFREIVSAVLDNHRQSGWYPEAVAINWEDPDLICDHTGERIESAYAETED
jgi:hypothetical protein